MEEEEKNASTERERKEIAGYKEQVKTCLKETERWKTHGEEVQQPASMEDNPDEDPTICSEIADEVAP